MLQGCKKSTDSEERCSPFTGITETDENANIIGTSDPDDWKESGVLSNLRAYPNPYNPVISIGFSLSRSATVKITINNQPTNIIRTLVDQSFAAGSHQIIWDSKTDSGDDVPDCIYRIYFSATTDDGTDQTFGDIELKTKI
jgi:hypothetical protein